MKFRITQDNSSSIGNCSVEVSKVDKRKHLINSKLEVRLKNHSLPVMPCSVNLSKAEVTQYLINRKLEFWLHRIKFSKEKAKGGSTFGKNFNISISTRNRKRNSKTDKSETPDCNASDMFTAIHVPNYVDQLGLLLDSSVEVTPEISSNSHITDNDVIPLVSELSKDETITTPRISITKNLKSKRLDLK